MKIIIHDIPENMDFSDYPDDTEFVIQDSEPRYILEPFEIIPCAIAALHIMGVETYTGSDSQITEMINTRFYTI